VLADEGALEAQADAQRLLAAAVARQTFGCLLLPESPADAWLLEGLAGHLAGQYLRELLGPAELAHARHKERAAVAAGDDGRMAPLYMRPHGARVGAAVYGSTYGTEVGAGDASMRAGWAGLRCRRTLPITLLPPCPARCSSPARCATSRQWR
jgi:hypothetical protein